jgi:hypothetical protein
LDGHCHDRQRNQRIHLEQTATDGHDDGTRDGGHGGPWPAHSRPRQITNRRGRNNDPDVLPVGTAENHQHGQHYPE